MSQRRNKRPARTLPLPRQPVPSGRSLSSPWVFRILAITLMPALCLVLLEGALRLGGYGNSTDFLLKRDWTGKAVLIPNLRFGWRFFGPVQARQPASFMLAQDKPGKTIRVFVFGESAAYGDPQPDFGLPRLLQVLLRNRYPGVDFEVVNAAMTGINSHVIRAIARDCASAQGDIWVIYMGNNEVVGPYGPGTVFGRPAPPLPLIRSSLALKATRTGQWLDRTIYQLNRPPEDKEEWGGMQMFLGRQLRQDDPRMRRVYEHFARNLDDIIEFGLERKAGIVISTVAVNLRDCAPFASENRPGLTAEDKKRWKEFFDKGALLEKEQFARGPAGPFGKERQAGSPASPTTSSWLEVAEAYDAAANIDDGHAELQYRWARCCLEMGKTAEARAHFERARDLDTLRFRCDSQLNGMIRETATRHAQRGVRLADAEAVFAQESLDGITGNKYFLEHVHLAFEGNYLLALTLAREVEKILPEWLRQGTPPAPSWPSLETCARQLGYQGWDRYQGATEILGRLYDPPFTYQLNHQEQLARWMHELESLRAELQAPVLRQNETACQEAIAAAPNDWVLYSHLARIRQQLGDLPGSVEAARQVTRLLPWAPASWQQLGILLQQQRKHEEAIVSLREAVRVDPDNFWALIKLGQCQAALGRHPEAITAYEKALAIKPRLGPAHLGLGRSLEALGRSLEAKASYQRALQYRVHRKAELVELMEFCRGKGWQEAALTNCLEALRMNPGAASLHLSAGQILTALNRAPEAQRHYAEAVRLDGNLVPARYLAGLQLGRQGNPAAAAEQFQEVVRLMPELVEARLNLGIALSKLGRADQARAQFEEVLRRQPTNAVALREIKALGEAKEPEPSSIH